MLGALERPYFYMRQRGGAYAGWAASAAEGGGRREGGRAVVRGDHTHTRDAELKAFGGCCRELDVEDSGGGVCVVCRVSSPQQTKSRSAVYGMQTEPPAHRIIRESQQVAKFYFGLLFSQRSPKKAVNATINY